MLGEVEVLLSHEHSLAKEVLVDFLAVCFRDKPGEEMSAEPPDESCILLHCCEFLALFVESHTTLNLF
jgi:hypothetical protein